MRIAFLAASPMSIARPICANTPRSKPRKRSPRNAPSTATGTDSSTENGSDQLSYSAARTRNTNTSDTAKTASAVPEAFFS